MAGIFKAYDVRGLYPSELDEKGARAIGLAIPHVLDLEAADSRTVVVGRDMRSHSPSLAEALIDGLTAAGLDVIDIGLATTPMSYFAVGHLGTAGGVQVTASHNPSAYNGLKISKHGARPLAGENGIPLLEKLVQGGQLEPASTRGSVRRTDIFEAYGQHLESFLERPQGAKRLKVVVDAANGMGTLYQPLLERAGIDLIPLYFELDGSFPNHEANPLKIENLEVLRAEVLRHQADLGVSFDGDADRAAFVDQNGEPIGSDLSTALIAGELLVRQPGRAIVYDLRSSRAVAEYIREHGGEPIRERVGHTFIKATLRRQQGIFGGELAGHYYFEATYTADSALLAVYEILNLLWKTQQPISNLIDPLRRYAKSEETNFQVEDKQGLIDTLAEKYSDGEIDTLDGVTVQFDDWWFNVRPSNTEPYLRLVAEAASEEMLADKMAELCEILGQPV